MLPRMTLDDPTRSVPRAAWDNLAMGEHRRRSQSAATGNFATAGSAATAGSVAVAACVRCTRCVACVGCVDCANCIGCVGCVGLRNAVCQRGRRAA
jgi:hypothetical protein